MGKPVANIVYKPRNGKAKSIATVWPPSNGSEYFGIQFHFEDSKWNVDAVKSLSRVNAKEGFANIYINKAEMLEALRSDDEDFDPDDIDFG